MQQVGKAAVSHSRGTLLRTQLGTRPRRPGQGSDRIGPCGRTRFTAAKWPQFPSRGVTTRVEGEGKSPSGSWPMAALELTPQDVSAAVETDVTQLSPPPPPPPASEKGTERLVGRREGRGRGARGTPTNKAATSHQVPGEQPGSGVPTLRARAPPRPAPPPPGTRRARPRSRVASERARARPPEEPQLKNGSR